MAKNILKEDVYNYLYERIVSGSMCPGEAIVEQDIANQLNISRTPIREAIKQLGYEGLVRNLPVRGTFVTELSTQDIEEIFFLREVLELAALRTGIENIPKNSVQELEEQLLSLTFDSPNEDYFNSDRNLHLLILKSAGNRRLIQIINNLNSQIERLRRLSAMTPKRLLASKEEHLAIVRAIKGRNLETASAILSVHIKNVCSSVISICRNMYMSA